MFSVIFVIGEQAIVGLQVSVKTFLRQKTCAKHK